MAKTLTKLREQKPAFIHVDEPVSGSTNPQAQDSQVLATGDVTHNVEGVDNRATAHLWGLMKLMADIMDAGHEDDGTHELVDQDIAPNALIDEAQNKLKLMSGKVVRPDNPTKHYTTTEDIVDVLNKIWPSQIHSLHLSQIEYANSKKTQSILEWIMPSAWDKKKDIVPSEQSAFIVSDDELLFMAGYRIRLFGSNNPAGTSKCFLDIGDASGRHGTPLVLAQQTIISLEIFEHDVTASGYAFPYGNTQFKNTNRAADNYVGYAHSDSIILVTDPEFSSFIGNEDNNVKPNVDGKLSQICYRFSSQPINYDLYKWGLEDPVAKSFVNGQPIYVNPNYQGCWISQDGKVNVVPVMIASRLNMGIYHESFNPAGTGKTRTGLAEPLNFSQCFQQSRIGYFDANGVECSNYNLATYDYSTDTYVYQGTEYYHSGLVISRVTMNPSGKFVDIIEVEEVLSYKRELSTPAKALFTLEQKMIANQLESEMMPVYYGTVQSKNQAKYYSKKPYQILGFGVDEASLFGTANLGGVFVDKCNNGTLGHIDEARRVWSDKSFVQSVAWSLMHGNSNSESKPTMISYEPVSGTITINTTSLSSQPLIYGDASDPNTFPVMMWENGDSVQLSLTWTGLGTSTASCTLQETDANAHQGQMIYAVHRMLYPKGCGVPFVIENPLMIKDVFGNQYPILTTDEITNLTELNSFTGTAAVGNTHSLKLVLDSTASTVNDFYNGLFLHHVKSGEVRQVTDYSGTTREVTLNDAFGSTIEAGDVITISKLEPNANASVIVDRRARGILSAYTKKRFVANTAGVVTIDKPIIYSSAGLVKGSMIINLQAGQIIDVIYESEEPFKSGFKLYFTHRPQLAQFDALDNMDRYEIIMVGNLFSTNIGSANNPDNSYLMFTPTYSVPPTDGIKWIGTVQDNNLSSSIAPLKNAAWELIIPYEGLTLRGEDMKVEFNIGEGNLELRSPSVVEQSAVGVFTGTLLVRSALTGRYIMLVGVTSLGKFGFYKFNNVFAIEVNKNFAISFK